MKRKAFTVEGVASAKRGALICFSALMFTFLDLLAVESRSRRLLSASNVGKK